MANNRSSASAAAHLSGKGLPSAVRESQLCWKCMLETTSQHSAPLPCQSISRCKKASRFPDQHPSPSAAAGPSQKRKE